MEGESVLILAAPYRYHVTGKLGVPKWGCLYEPLLLARDAHTMQEVIVYKGFDGYDAGNVYTCPLMDWALRFTLEADRLKALEPPKPPCPMPDRPVPEPSVRSKFY